MEKLKGVIKAFSNALMTLIITVGVIFIALYFIGIVPYVVESGSMEPKIQTGSLSFVNKHINYDNIEENDIIAFKVSTGDIVVNGEEVEKSIQKDNGSDRKIEISTSTGDVDVEVH